MTQPSKPLVPQGPLTFEELRLANIVSPQNSPDYTDALQHAGIPVDMDVTSMSRALADQVIQTDKIAAALGIDLAAAIRERFDPTTGRIHNLTYLVSTGEPAGDLLNDLERQRSGT